MQIHKFYAFCIECNFDKMMFMVDLRIDIKTKKMLNIAPRQKSCVIWLANDIKPNIKFIRLFL